MGACYFARSGTGRPCTGAYGALDVAFVLVLAVYLLSSEDQPEECAEFAEPGASAAIWLSMGDSCSLRRGLRVDPLIDRSYYARSVSFAWS